MDKYLPAAFSHQASTFQNNIYQFVTKKLSEISVNNNIQNNNNPSPPSNNNKQLKTIKLKSNDEPITSTKPLQNKTDASTPTMKYTSSEFALKYKVDINKLGNPIEEKLYDTLQFISVEEIENSQDLSLINENDEEENQFSTFDKNRITNIKIRKILEMLENDMHVSYEEQQQNSTFMTSGNKLHCCHKSFASGSNIFCIGVLVFLLNAFGNFLEALKMFFDNLTSTIWKLLKIEQNCLMALFCVIILLILLAICFSIWTIYYFHKFAMRPIYKKYLPQ